MTEPNYSIGFTAQMLAATSCGVGDALVYDASTGYWVVATAANRASLGKRTEAIALSAYGGSAVGKVSYQVSGVLAQSKSGLDDDADDPQLVRVSSTGTLERIATDDVDPDTDDIVGYAETDGRVHLFIGLPLAEIVDLGGGGGGGGSPGGSTGSIQVNDGAGGFTGYSTVLAGSAFISIGSTVASGGSLRFGSAAAVLLSARNALDNANLSLLEMDGADSLWIGSDTATTATKQAANVYLWCTDTGRLGAGTGTDATVAWSSVAFYVNKTLVLFDSDESHQYVVTPSNLSASRSITLPLLTADDTFVFEAHAQALSNKTYISVGSTPATTGDFRSNSTAHVVLAARNAGDSNNLSLLEMNGSDDLWIGSDVGKTTAKQIDELVLWPKTGGYLGASNGSHTASWSSTSFYVNKTFEIYDSNADATYIFVPSNLAASRNVTLPLLTGNDTFVFEAHAQALTNKTYIGGSGSLPSSGFVRLPYAATGVVIGTKDSGGNDIEVVGFASADTFQFGPTAVTNSSSQLRGYNITHVFNSGGVSVWNTSGGLQAMRLSGTELRVSVPVGGNQTEVVPFRWNHASVDTGSGAGGVTLTAAQAECPYITFTGSYASPKLIQFPNSTGAFYIVDNQSSGTRTVSDDPLGTGVTIAASKADTVIHDGTDYIKAVNP